jgi:alkylation response protein AidB-like acyl-CoA dehydrogenase
MADFVPPLRELRFVLDEIAGVEGLRALEGFDDLTSDIVDAVLEEAGKFAANEIAPLNRPGDVEGARLANGVVTTPSGFSDAYQAFVAAGWNGVAFPTEWGGQGLPRTISTAVNEMVTTASVAFSLCPMLTHGAIDLLVHHGSDSQKATYLPRLISGEWTGTMNLTEPNAGSDVGALRARAVREGDHYRISGTKIFITYGEHDMAENIVHMVLARTPGAPEGSKGISCFIVPKFLVNPDGTLGERNDVRCVSIEHKLGIHGSPTAVLSFGDSGGAVGYLVGEEQDGMRCMFTMMNMARLDVGLEGVGIAERAYQQALAYAADRVQGRPLGKAPDGAGAIIGHPDVRRMLMVMRTLTEAARGLAYFTVAQLDVATHHADAEARRRAQARVDLLIPVVKSWSTDIGVEVASIGVQVHGGMGFIEETGAAQHYRDARITPIYEGTNGIQALDLVGRKLGYDSGLAIVDLVSDMRSLDAALAADERLAGLGRQLASAISALESATDWMSRARQDGDPREWAAGATDYLALLGVTAGGYVMARSALAAARRLSAGDGDAPFLEAKMATARFYGDYVLPRVHALLGPATRGMELVDALSFAQLQR